MIKQIDLRRFIATNDVCTKLNNLRRWTDFTTQQKYNELAKQAFNCIVAFMLAHHAESKGKTICYEKFPRIAIGRAFAKVYVYFDTPEHKINEICNLNGISKDEFDIVATKIISEKTDKEFAQFLSEERGEYEVQIYKAATKIATYIELFEQQKNISDFSKFQEIQRDIDSFKDDIPGIYEFSDTNSPIFKLLQELSKLRNQVRWATCSYNTECSVLGHLFDTAVFAYLLALNESNFDEEYASKMFFMGIFHDVAETWTKDIPSPIKDRIDGFRVATEKYELHKLEQKMYSKVPEYLQTALKSVMMEDEENAKYKKALKAADYLSADSECYRNLLSGSRDPYFCKAIKRRKIDEDLSKLYKAVHNYFVKYVNKVNL